jgi:acetamidase/formamidase
LQRIAREQAHVYALDAALEPVLRVAAGEPFTVETDDASSGLLTSGELAPTLENLPYARFSPAKANPVGGPVHVEGVAARGRVKVEIDEIAVAETGVWYNRPPLSPLRDSREWPEGGEAYSILVRHEGDAAVAGRMRWPLVPMIGTLACAPEWEVHSTTAGQGPFGGNLDVGDYQAGATVYLTSYHEGGLLFVGDVHGCQGDGEWSSVADESRAEVVLRAFPEPGDPLPAPRLVTPDRIVALGIARPLEVAVREAIMHLLRWLVDELGFTRREAYLAVGLNPEFRIRVYQMTVAYALDYVAGASLPRPFVGLI